MLLHHLFELVIKINKDFYINKEILESFNIRNALFDIHGVYYEKDHCQTVLYSEKKHFEPYVPVTTTLLSYDFLGNIHSVDNRQFLSNCNYVKYFSKNTNFLNLLYSYSVENRLTKKLNAQYFTNLDTVIKADSLIKEIYRYLK